MFALLRQLGAFAQLGNLCLQLLEHAHVLCSLRHLLEHLILSLHIEDLSAKVAGLDIEREVLLIELSDLSLLLLDRALQLA